MIFWLSSLFDNFLLGARISPSVAFLRSSSTVSFSCSWLEVSETSTCCSSNSCFVLGGAIASGFLSFFLIKSNTPSVSPYLIFISLGGLRSFNKFVLIKVTILSKSSCIGLTSTDSLSLIVTPKSFNDMPLKCFLTLSLNCGKSNFHVSSVSKFVFWFFKSLDTFWSSICLTIV